LQNNYKIKILDNFTYSKNFIENTFLLNNKLEFIHRNMNVINSIDNIFKNIDSVVLLAGLVGDPITKKHPELAIKINRDYCKLVIDASIKNKIKRLIFISTCSNYGLINNQDTAGEDYKLNPISLYAKCKVEIEEYIQSKNEKICITILRFATAFGESPRMRYDLTINEFIYELIHTKKLLVYDPDTWRPYCHVKDFARLIEQVLRSERNLIEGEIFNVGSDVNNFTKRQIVNMIIRFIKNCEIVYKEQGSDPRNYRVSFKKIKQQLDFQAKYNVEDYMAKLINIISEQKISNKMNYGNHNINIK
jgi:nucleoside-diphosphate-sugar epimerase